jgi:hypothetical protein
MLAMLLQNPIDSAWRRRLFHYICPLILLIFLSHWMCPDFHLKAFILSELGVLGLGAVIWFLKGVMLNLTPIL